MSNLEHLIENTLIAMESNELKPNEIKHKIENDINFINTNFSADDIYEICVYFLYTWCMTCERCDIKIGRQ